MTPAIAKASRRAVPRRILLAAAAAAGLVAATPAAAQLTVIDPSNLAQNVLAAARSLEQINNQIAQIENQTASLLNEAANLASLPLSTLATLEAQLDRTRALLAEAQRIAYDVDAIEQMFADQYRAIDLTASDAALVEDARERWTNSVAGFEDSLRVQAGVVGHLTEAQDAMAALIAASQDAEGALQAAQAGNQLVALQTRQLADLTALVAAQARADALEGARAAAAQAQAREQLRRFLARPTGYQPGDARLFHE